MSATIPSTTQHHEELDGVFRTLLRLLERQRLVKGELAAPYRGLEDVAEVLYNRAMSDVDHAR